MLDREEYIEQAYLFRILGERLPQNMPLQELLRQVREELLATTKLPLAVDFLRSELEHSGAFAPAMARLSHYFTPYQTYVVDEAENERGRFDMRIALAILQAEAGYGWRPHPRVLLGGGLYLGWQLVMVTSDTIVADGIEQRVGTVLHGDPLGFRAGAMGSVGVRLVGQLWLQASAGYGLELLRQQDDSGESAVEIFGRPQAIGGLGYAF